MILQPVIDSDSFWYTPNLSTILNVKDIRDSNQKATTVYSIYNYPFYKKQNISEISFSPTDSMEPTKLTKGKETIEILTDYFSLWLRQTRQSDAIKIWNDLLYKENTLFLWHAVNWSRYTVVLEEHPYWSQTSTNYIYIYSCK